MNESSRFQIETTFGGEPQAKGARKREVRFPDELGELATTVERVVNREDWSDEDRAALWLSVDEYLLVKQEARFASEGENWTNSLLDNVFAEKSRDSQEKLNQWVRASPAHRGMEKMANPGLGDARQQAQFHAVLDVIRVQDEMVLSSGKADPEEVRKVSMKATRAARHFARMLAKADALAVDMSEVSSTRYLSSDERPRRSSDKSKLPPKRRSTTTSADPASPDSSKKTIKETKDGKKGKKRDKAKEKEENQTAKKKDETKRNSFTKKLQETTAGIIARMPRIA